MEMIKKRLDALPTPRGILNHTFRSAAKRDLTVEFLNGYELAPNAEDLQWHKKNRFYSIKSLAAAGEEAARSGRNWRLGWCLDQAESLLIQRPFLFKRWFTAAYEADNMASTLFVLNRAQRKMSNIETHVQETVWNSVINNTADATKLYEMGYSTNSVLTTSQNHSHLTLAEAAVVNNSPWVLARLLEFEAPTNRETLKDLARRTLEGQNFGLMMSALETKPREWKLDPDSKHDAMVLQTSDITKTTIYFGLNMVEYATDPGHGHTKSGTAIPLEKSLHRKMIRDARRALEQQKKQPQQLRMTY